MYKCKFCECCFKNKQQLGGHVKNNHPENKREVIFTDSSFVSGRARNEEYELARRKKISETMKNNPEAGGYRKGSGRGKSGWYKGIYCDSSWELAYVIYCMDHDIKIVRNKKKFTYIFEGKQRFYIPDFVINDKELIEIKGYRTNQWEAKLDSMKNTIKVLYEKDLKNIFEYVIMNYGKDYIKLYE